MSMICSTSELDLAHIHGVETRVLNQAAGRNARHFPPTCLLALSREEIPRILHTAISLSRLKFSKQVRAFTEHGALMAGAS